MNEPTQTLPNRFGNGRPVISEIQYRIWLDDMRPFLRRGMSLNYAIDKAGLNNHRTAIYEKSRENGWFSDRVTSLQAIVGEQINEAVARLVKNIYEKVVAEGSENRLTHSDVSIIKLVAERHRSSKPFFVTRSEMYNNHNKTEMMSRIPAVLDKIEAQTLTD